jgi:hypothetical protein
MPVKVYTSQDLQGKPWPPDTHHEAVTTIDLIRRIWEGFNHLPDTCAIAVNLHKPSADMVIITRHGIGVIELKHYSGKILINKQDGIWYADSKQINAGSPMKGYRNPHGQVQSYADEIKRKLIKPPPNQNPWLPGKSIEWQGFKLQTAVCFTNPLADVISIKKYFQPDRYFSIITPVEIAAWVSALRFEIDQGRENQFQPYTLTHEQIIAIAGSMLRGMEWQEVINHMHDGKPYAYLMLIDQGKTTQVFPLDKDEITIGRDPDRDPACRIIIREQYNRVSTLHAKITRHPKGVHIQDLNSTNGTFVNGRLLPKGKIFNLREGVSLTLGGPDPTEKVCLLEYVLRSPESEKTEAATNM